MSTRHRENRRLWKENPSAVDLIRRRSPVGVITEEVVKALIAEAVKAVQARDIETLLGLFSPDFSMATYELVGGALTPVVQNRDSYEISALAWLNSSNTDGFSMRIKSISIDDDQHAKVELLVSNSTDPTFVKYFGKELTEIAEVKLFDKIPVVSQASIRLGSD